MNTDSMAPGERIAPTDVWQAQQRDKRARGPWFGNTLGTIARMLGRSAPVEVDAAVAKNLQVEQMALDLAEQLKWNGRAVNADVLREAARLLDLSPGIFAELPELGMLEAHPDSRQGIKYGPGLGLARDQEAGPFCTCIGLRRGETCKVHTK